jgi:hypothetical protein
VKADMFDPETNKFLCFARYVVSKDKADVKMIKRMISQAKDDYDEKKN